ncbi:DUF6686 family protein [Mangrovibacterium marinum]|uniref:Uncharacterized protein n=1 Tax=Mangrovibacterium marinum TaxID=1639118 RepID=A0A2T5BYP0_9BACT|nr:DUF6686 family protein [Mangrovibacterium marinum]PTN07365.1 hypothetical protein C8N47_11816 [Mangrovibacterium marinum]
MIRGEEQEIINQTINGKVYRCQSCNKIHVDFKNLSFSFNKTEYRNFKEYMKKLDGDYWLQQNERQSGKPKIMIPINHRNLLLSFSKGELIELKNLLSSTQQGRTAFRWVTTRSMDFQLSDN